MAHIPLTAALGEDYAGLVGRDLPALGEGFTITLRFGVNKPYRPQCYIGTH